MKEDTNSMKTLLVIKKNDVAALQSQLTPRSPLMAKICNKPWLEYLLEFAILCGSRHIRLATDLPTAEVNAWAGSGSCWGIDLSYAAIQDRDQLDDVLLKNHQFVSDSRLLVMQGNFFLHYDKNLDYAGYMQHVPAGELLSCTGGRVEVRGPESEKMADQTISKPFLDLSSLSSVNDLYHLSMSILSTSAERYVIPGYNNDPAIYIGRNVAIAKNVKIIAPVVIGNQVQLHRDCVVGPNVVIGNNVIISSSSQVQDTVIQDNTYVGEHLTLTKKLVAGATIIDPEKTTRVQLEDPHLLSNLEPEEQRAGLAQKCCQSLLAALLLALLLLPYAILSLWLKKQQHWTRREKNYLLNGSGGKIVRLPHISISQASFPGRLASALHLDRVPLLTLVLSGKLFLIGSELRPAGRNNLARLAEDGQHRPAVFSYAEAESWVLSRDDQELSERFHLGQSSPMHDFSMLVKILRNKTDEDKALCESIKIN